MDLDVQKKMFADHIATLRDYGDIKVLDFQKPESNYYRIRFIFEEDHDRVHISGDLGELIAYSRAGMEFRYFINYCYHNPVLVKAKVQCSSRPVTTYDRELARKQLIAVLKDKSLYNKVIGCYWYLDDDSEPEEVEEALIGDALEDFSEVGGIGVVGKAALMNIDSTAFWPIDEIGLEEGPGIVDLYLLAFKLAYKQLQEKGVVK